MPAHYPGPVTLPRSLQDTLVERHSQCHKGFDETHDDKHTENELYSLGLYYLTGYPEDWPFVDVLPPAELPDIADPAGYRKRLVKALACLSKEVDRLDRAAPHLTSKSGL